MLDLLLIALLGFAGSFGHCVGMCSPLAIAFSLSSVQSDDKSGVKSSDLKSNGKPESNASPKTADPQANNWPTAWQFHGLLNLGRILSYGLVGAALGGVSSLAIAGGQLAGIGSNVRQVVVMLTGLMLIWIGLGQILPQTFPRLPLLHPLQEKLHQRLSSALSRLSLQQHWWTPLLLGTVWGLIPCGFLYTAQIKAAATGTLWSGGATMLAFGLGTVPAMLGVGIFATRWSADRRSQLYRLGGWTALIIGFLTLARTDAMVDYTGHGSLLLLALALLARPLSIWWSAPMAYRRIIGIGAFVLAIAHTARMASHTFNWNFSKILFLLPQHQIGTITGLIALLLMLPAALTSTDGWQARLGHYWRKLHLLCVPAMIFAGVHTILLGSHYLGTLSIHWGDRARTLILIISVVIIVALRRAYPRTRLRNKPQT